MVSFRANFPKWWKFSRKSPVQLELNGDTLQLAGDNWQDAVPLSQISRIRAGSANENLPRFALPSIPVSYYELRIWRRDRTGVAVVQPELAAWDDYARFMDAFVPAAQREAPNAVFETGIHRGIEGLWGFVFVLGWLCVMLWLGTKVLNRVMTGELETTLWVVTILGIVAIVAVTIRAVWRAPAGADAILQREVPRSAQAG